MNKTILAGRLTKDPELQRSSGNLSYINFTLAVKRPYKGPNGQQADFINCVAWKKTAELISQYCSKGSQILVEGNIQTSSYTKDGKTHYTTNVNVESIEFLQTAQKEQDTAQTQTPYSQYDYGNSGYQTPTTQPKYQGAAVSPGISTYDFQPQQQMQQEEYNYSPYDDEIPF